MTLGAGTRLGPYEIRAPIGAGGMGVVYKATDTRLGREVALKVMARDRLAAPDRVRFVREARAAAALNHSNIVTIYAIDADAGIDYIAMEYVAGGTLADLLLSGPLPTQRALKLASQVADALVAAHAARLVHRDLKPSNIMLSADDRVKVVDFGLARFDEARASAATTEALTESHAVVGTVPYMSPEQALGERVDARSDLFSLGSILYEMLAGRRPFGGRTDAETLAAILRDAPAAIPTAAPDLTRLVERCLRKDPTERFQSAADLKAAIEACRGGRRAPERPSVAVLPFTNMSGTREDDFLCEGLAEEIINALTRIPGLHVIARTSAFAVARMGLDLCAAGTRLGAQNMLEGSVRRAGNRVRVAAQLVSAGDGTHLWSERYDRELTDVLALEDEIATAIATRLRVELAREEGGGRAPRPVDAEAHEAYLEGRYYFARGTPEALARAKGCYERAIARDPNAALAYDSLAELYWFLGFFGGVPPREAFSMSTWYALRALELDGTLAQTHALLGMLRKELDYNWPEVDRELARARDLNPESPLVQLRHAISGLLPQARVDEAVAELDAIVRRDPLSLIARWWLAIMEYLARRPERVVAEGRHMIALDEAHFLGHWVLGIGLIESGRADEAVTSLRRAHELSGGTPFTLGFLAYGAARAGRADETGQLLAGAEQRAATTYVPPSAFMLAYIGLEQWDAAFDWMDRAIEARDPLIMPIKTYPFLDPVRGDARYRGLLRKMNLE